jgi:hypothetical protein
MGQRARVVLLVVALVSCGLAGLMVGSVAFGRANDQVCTSYVCADWGINGFASTLLIKNPAAPGGATITGETFSGPAGTVFTGVAGTTDCQAQGSQVQCAASILPGATFRGDILTQGGNPPVDTTASLVVVVGATQEPPISMRLQPTSPVNSTTTSTECQAELGVVKSLEASHPRYAHDLKKLKKDWYVTGWHLVYTLRYRVVVTNLSDCDATNVVVDDKLPKRFDCAKVFVPSPRKTVKCFGGRVSTVGIGDLPAHESRDVYFYGTYLDPTAKQTNQADAEAANAPKKESNEVAVTVVGR